MLPRCISLTASWIKKKGARALTCMMRSYSSGEVSQMEPRSVTAAALTSTCKVPNASSAAAMTRRQFDQFLQVPGHETGTAAGGFQLRHHRLAALLVASAQHYAGRAAGR